MKKYAIIFGSLFLAAAMGSAAFAQAPGMNYDAGKFQRGYLDSHPEVARQLAHNPGLIDNPTFMANHHELQAYLNNHPEVRHELKHHPQAFMSDEWHHDVYGGGPGGRPMSSTDRYMDAHPEVAAQLEKNPGLVDNPTYLAEHPGLHDYLRDHPVARHEWKTHPHKYMSNEEKYQHNH